MTMHSDKIHTFVCSLLAYGYVLRLERDPDQDDILWHEYHMLTEQDAQECTNKLMSGATLYIFSREEWDDEEYGEAGTRLHFDRTGHVANIREFFNDEFIHKRLMEILP
jgi:hypothetical protein